MPSAAAVGGYWLRNGQNEVDLVGADKAPSPKHVLFAGSVKWRDSSSQPFGRKDYDALVASAFGVPGYEKGTPLVGVSRSGFEGKLPLTVALQPEDLLAAWD